MNQKKGVGFCGGFHNGVKDQPELILGSVSMVDFQYIRTANDAAIGMCVEI